MEEDSTSEGGGGLEGGGSETAEKQFLQHLSQFLSELDPPQVLTAPLFSKKRLSLYHLYKAITGKGGYDEVTQLKMWKPIARSLGASESMTSASTTLRVNYEKYLYLYEQVFFFRVSLIEAEKNLGNIRKASSVGGIRKATRALSTRRRKLTDEEAAMSGQTSAFTCEPARLPNHPSSSAIPAHHSMGIGMGIHSSGGHPHAGSVPSSLSSGTHWGQDLLSSPSHVRSPVKTYDTLLHEEMADYPGKRMDVPFLSPLGAQFAGRTPVPVSSQEKSSPTPGKRIRLPPEDALLDVVNSKRQALMENFYLPLAEEKIDDSSSVDAFLRCMIAAMGRPASDADEFVERLAENWIVNVSQLYLIDDAGWNQLRFPFLLCVCLSGDEDWSNSRVIRRASDVS
eukprot:TRINITY_DN3225_c1_g1_i3.p2 TRINITY_DN3225_c1_g1~~TRINITY_DN3225_c1_g1_i3.p2  ORF type:complete len:397 (-),score=106.50 TRINITY_DN3225_c1_g1_i3:952-2142(-)